MPRSEAESASTILAPYCLGFGVDVGCGERKITPWAIGLDYEHRDGRTDLPMTDADIYGPWETWFASPQAQGLDFVFSAHLLEDYVNWQNVLETWLGAISPDALLVLLLPDERRYRDYCHEHAQPYNENHRAEWAGPADFLEQLGEALRIRMEPVASGTVEPYSFYVVLRRLS